MTELKEGDRIRLLAMPDDPNPIPDGTTGTVTKIGGWLPSFQRTRHPQTRQVFVDWDIERSLILIDGIDQYEILTEE